MVKQIHLRLDDPVYEAFVKKLKETGSSLQDYISENPRRRGEV